MIKLSVKTTDFDKGMKELEKEIALLKGKPYVKVGVLEKAGDHKDSPLSVASLATIHEFGAPNAGIPERSFLRSSMDDNRERLLIATDQMRSLIFMRKMTTLNALKLLGLRIQSFVQDKFRNNSWEPLAISTIQARLNKRRSDKTKNADETASVTPLIDTGQLRQSIRYEVVEKS